MLPNRANPTASNKPPSPPNRNPAASNTAVKPASKIDVLKVFMAIFTYAVTDPGAIGGG